MGLCEQRPPEELTALQSMKHVGVFMKDPVYRARCIDKVLSKHSALEVMEGLADVALDLFQLGLRDQGKSASREQIRRQIRELDKWKKTTSRN